MTDFQTFVGIDVSKDTLEVHIRPEGTGFQVANSRRGRSHCRCNRRQSGASSERAVVV